ncbi:MAG: tetratricopeptide repeat protein [Candidatus Hydrogenedentes bacterium]|nr:tetratricopeptide repeat protein [Candidatus Hydrogenedentota bacterium]
MRYFVMLTRQSSQSVGLLAVALLVSASANGQAAADRTAYLAQIAELQELGPEIARAEGKEALIQRYRDLIDANPGQPNNIQLEVQIGLIYESDLSENGEPPNPQAAYNTYQNIIATYEPSSSYMKRVRQLSAQRAMELDPEAARTQYEGMIEDYPGDEAIVLESLYNMARLAEQEGDDAEARRLYEEVLNHVPAGESLSESEKGLVDAYQANAALSLLAQAIREHATPSERLAAIEAFLEQHPELAESQSDLISRLLESVEETGENEEKQALKESVQTLVRLLGDHAKQGAGSKHARPGKRAQAAAQQMEITQADGQMAASLEESPAAASAEQAQSPAEAPMESVESGVNAAPETPVPATEMPSNVRMLWGGLFALGAIIAARILLTRRGNTR